MNTNDTTYVRATLNGRARNLPERLRIPREGSGKVDTESLLEQALMIEPGTVVNAILTSSA